MRHRHLWFASVFVSVPAILFACGGRSDIDLILDEAPAAGRGGAAGAAGKGGAGGKSGTSGASGTSNTAGTGQMACVPGQQVECPCPGSDLKGVQVCADDGQSFGECSGCSGQGAGGSSGAGGKGGKAGAGGKGGKAGAGNTGGNEADGGKDFFDALPIPLPDSGPVGECVNCLQENCNDSINKCYNDPDCAQGIQCAITECFIGGMGGGGTMGGGNPIGGGNPLGGGGGLNFQCLLGCFNGDISAAFAAIQSFQCITQTCGSVCGGDILGGGGGGFPLGGLGGGPGPMPGAEALYIDDVRVPTPQEVPGYPWLQQALKR